MKAEKLSISNCQLSIIIPHWNGKVHLEDCLGSLRVQSYQDFVVILVDNGSTDGSQAYVKAYFPEVVLLELGENKGFTGACNAGIKSTNTPYVVLLNNDTEVDKNWAAEVMGGFERHENAGILASKMLLFNQRDTFHNAGDLTYLDGTPNNRGVWQKDIGQFDHEEAVFSACGGSSAFRRTMLDQIGLLDDDFFFSCEDVDLAWRAQLAGWDVIYIPTAIVYHKLKATGGNVTGSYYDGRNFLYLLWKNYPTSLLKKHWRLVLKKQLTITKEALKHWRGEAARARLRGQIAGIFGLPKMLRKRRAIQTHRRLSDKDLIIRLTPVDEKVSER